MPNGNISLAKYKAVNIITGIKNAIIYTFLKQIKVLIHKNIEEPIEISVQWKDKEIKEKIEENDMIFYWKIEENDREINELKVNCSENATDKLLICIL